MLLARALPKDWPYSFLVVFLFCGEVPESVPSPGIPHLSSPHGHMAHALLDLPLLPPNSGHKLDIV